MPNQGDKMKDWNKKEVMKEVDRILKEGSFNSRLEAFMEKLQQEESYPPEEWQEVFNTFFESLLEEYPSFACCILAFQAGQVWQKYYEREDG